MGTTYSVKISSSESVDTSQLKKEVDELLVEINRQMSTYIPSSEISSFNKFHKTEKFKISSYFYKVLEYSLGLAELTGGVFDPTIGPLVNLWGFGPQGPQKVPSEDEIKDMRLRVGYKKLRLEGSEWAVKTHPNLYVDLSATAKGFAVDEVSSLMLKKGYKNHLVEIGGEMKLSGTKGREAWRVAIETPDENKRAIQKILKLTDIAIATSGNYRNFFKEGGKKFSHTIDVSTGKPVQHKLASVTVLSKTCMDSDGMATALMAMGPKKAWDFANKNKLAAYFIMLGQKQGSFEIKKTPEFGKSLSK